MHFNFRGVIASQILLFSNVIYRCKSPVPPKTYRVQSKGVGLVLELGLCGQGATSLVLVPPVAHHTLLHTTMSPSFGLGLQLMSVLWLPPTGLVVCVWCVCMVCMTQLDTHDLGPHAKAKSNINKQQCELPVD